MDIFGKPQHKVSVCIVSKRVVAFTLPLEIFIYIPILPHRNYNLLSHPRSFSLLTFPFFPLPFVLLFCSFYLFSPFLTSLPHPIYSYSSSSSLSSSSASLCFNFKCSQTSGSY